MTTLDDVTNLILGDVLQSTSLEQALYPRSAAAPLGIDVLGDEHENPNQPYRATKPAPMSDEMRAKLDDLRNNWLRERGWIE